MKIALVLRGHYRTFEKVENSWEIALNNCDYTCFFHTWDTIDSSTISWCKKVETTNDLLSDQINTLKLWDVNLEIEKQIFTEDEINDIYATATFKSYIYKFNALRKTFNRINKNDFDLIIVGRYDIILKNVSFKDLIINQDEIMIGARSDNRFLHNLATSDAFFVFNSNDKIKFDDMPIDLIERKLKYSEECYVDFFYKSFKKVIHKWHQNTDFDIQR